MQREVGMEGNPAVHKDACLRQGVELTDFVALANTRVEFRSAILLSSTPRDLEYFTW